GEQRVAEHPRKGRLQVPKTHANAPCEEKDSNLKGHTPRGANSARTLRSSRGVAEDAIQPNRRPETIVNRGPDLREHPPARCRRGAPSDSRHRRARNRTLKPGKAEVNSAPPAPSPGALRRAYSSHSRACDWCPPRGAPAATNGRGRAR